MGQTRGQERGCEREQRQRESGSGHGGRAVHGVIVVLHDVKFPQADESKAAVADGGGGEVDGEKQPHVVGGGTTDAGAGLIALRGGSAIICAPGAGIRAFDFGHAWGADSRQSEVYEAAVAPLVCDVCSTAGARACSHTARRGAARRSR